MFSSAVERVKGLTSGDEGADEKRYPSDDAVRKPEEVSDPHTWRDESKTGFIQKAKNQPRTTVSYLAITFVVSLIFLAYSTTYAPGLYNSPLVRGIAKYSAVILVTAFATSKMVQGNIITVDWLVLYMPKRGLRVYIGEYDTDMNGNPRFTPIKGFGAFGSPGEKYTKGDMSNEWARVWSKRGSTADEPARIRLYESMCEVADTEYGTIVGQMCEEIVEDEFARDSDLVAEPPDIADKDKVIDLKEELKRKVAQLANVKDERDMFKDQRDEYRRQARKSREEILDEAHERQTELLDVFPSISVSTETEGATPEPDLSDYEGRVEEQTEEQ